MKVLQGANLLLMFVLELCVLAAAAWWGFTVSAPLAVRIVAGLVAPAVFIVVWALFGAAKDARFPQKGWRRIALEVLWFGAAAVLLGWAWTPIAGVGLFAIWFVNGVLRLVWGQQEL
ncbi:YrdB family protein [Nocardia sp. CDC160]|uniref:YrdB family protein n=1 Tax=Nocardia sp. CDC160 TaxID=3112166 RepID=UPI002DB60963|nr:YrdB family protein [Nocardia sp. CDC160]MEC3917382.1 YrdB family protein [Nocardia sp. CDC160]